MEKDKKNNIKKINKTNTYAPKKKRKEESENPRLEVKQGRIEIHKTKKIIRRKGISTSTGLTKKSLCSSGSCNGRSGVEKRGVKSTHSVWTYKAWKKIRTVNS